MIDGQVRGSVGGALVARAPVAALTAPGTEHAGAESLPGPRAVDGVVPAAVGLAGVVSAATTRAAGDDTADRAQLHVQIVGGLAGAVYSLGVLGVWNHLVDPSGRVKAGVAAEARAPSGPSRRSWQARGHRRVSRPSIITALEGSAGGPFWQMPSTGSPARIRTMPWLSTTWRSGLNLAVQPGGQTSDNWPPAPSRAR